MIMNEIDVAWPQRKHHNAPHHNHNLFASKLNLFLSFGRSEGEWAAHDSTEIPHAI